MAKTQTRPYDGAAYLKNKEDMVALLEAALEDGDPRVIAAAIGDIARAKGMTQITRANLSRIMEELAPTHEPLPEEDWNGIQETLFPLSTPGLREDLLKRSKEPKGISRKDLE